MIKLSATDKSGNRGLTGVNSVHRFRAECQTDVDELRQLLGQKIVKITMVQTPPLGESCAQNDGPPGRPDDSGKTQNSRAGQTREFFKK